MSANPKKLKFAVGISVIVVSLVFLVFTGFQKTSMYYFTVAELEAREADFVGRRIKLAGKVVPGSIEQSERLDYTFRIREPAGEDGEPRAETRLVHYKGIVPDTFRDEADVILEGTCDRSGVFHAETLLAKCPSKYESKSYDEMKEMHGAGPAATRS